jgi:hypothetical protein
MKRVTRNPWVGRFLVNSRKLHIVPHEYTFAIGQAILDLGLGNPKKPLLVFSHQIGAKDVDGYTSCTLDLLDSNEATALLELGHICCIFNTVVKAPTEWPAEWTQSQTTPPRS